MSNIFDGLQDNMFNVVTNTMGYDATWTPVAPNSTLQTARVLYNKPTEKRTLEEYQYNPNIHIMEYKKGDFEGLFESCRSNEMETVIIDIRGVSTSFYVQEIKAAWDGNNFIAQLQPY